ncbi:MAG TPA: hypothetical protein VJ861_03570, partial [Treponemataceae bacterium]|nr:hypothetical protein [Treponemataceae bacterium]
MKQVSMPNMTNNMLFHRLLALVFPTLFLTLFTSILHDYIDLFPAPGIFFFSFLMACGITALIMEKVSSSVRLPPSARLRAFLWLLLLAWLAHAILSPANGVNRFVPSITLIITLVAITIQWQWTTSIASCFEHRERLLGEVLANTGHALYTHMRDEGYLVNSVKSSMKSLSNSCIWAAGGLSLLIFSGVFFTAHVSLFSYILLVVFLVLTLVILIMTKFYTDELAQAALGLEEAFPLTQGRLWKAFPIVGSGALVALLVSRNKTVLPPDPFIWLYNALLRFARSFSRTHRFKKPDLTFPDLGLPMGQPSG